MRFDILLVPICVQLFAKLLSMTEVKLRADIVVRVGDATHAFSVSVSNVVMSPAVYRNARFDRKYFG